ncbi:MAG: 50S ribosomal protein L15 [Actinomycetota bacterium]|jgi:large subunit ribosomal protein L15|nr:50S ribosomal protein L15 [Ilumatobacteraceae bacterium]MDA2959526.1 50S ribosomal protein L15 [Actinomycetota bacterium]MDA3006487.1 50S ribosomal protein L15 [Actinomycetota bacterium]MDA3034639.1 50S ribosomal protein L15 [Actinomycetota bacterium]
MRVDDLAPAPGSRKRAKRVGRGIGGKGGKTAGRGTKGQRARNTVARGFEGGQMPLKQRVPKLRGFNNPFRVEYSPVNLHQLSKLGASTVDVDSLVAAGLVRKGAFVKVLAHGSIDTKVDVTVHAVSAAARAAIEAAGGSVTLVELPFRAEGRAGRPAAQGNQFMNR